MSEAAIERVGSDAPAGYSAAQQGSDVPLKWKPTAQKPVSVVRCVQIKKDGERCKNWSIRGYVRCRKHSGPGALMENGNVRKYAEAIVESSRLRLVDDADMAIDTLEQLTQPGSSEGIRLKAAESILDRAGIRGGFEVQIEADIKLDPSDTVKERLAKLAKGATAVQAMRERREEQDADIVEGEVISDTDDDEQGTLF